MNRFAALLAVVLLTACASQPAPNPAPAPVAAPVVAAPAPVPTPAPPVVPMQHYSLQGRLEFQNQCGEEMPSEVEIRATLSNAAHSVTTENSRVGLYGRFYILSVAWNESWGTPTTWTAFHSQLFNGEPVCNQSHCASGSCTDTTVQTPVAVGGHETAHDFTITCGCQQ